MILPLPSLFGSPQYLESAIALLHKIKIAMEQSLIIARTLIPFVLY